MRLGIDFGTTRTVVAAADRGNYPAVVFHNDAGDMQSWYPSLIAACDGGLEFALDARQRLGDPDWRFLSSFKRLLAAAAPDTPVRLGTRSIGTFDLLSAFLARLHSDLHERSSLEIGPDEPLEALVAVPANANSNQRFLTLEAFRSAGFHVLGLINEPSAAGIEYAHNLGSRSRVRKEYLAVYDLGGGTFDASVIGRADQHHEVLTDEGIERLGGDDFDEILADLVLSRAGGAELSEGARHDLLEECRRQKESLHPNTRRIAVDLTGIIEGAGTVVVPVEEFYELCTPLIDRTIEALESAVERSGKQAGAGWGEIAHVYLVGGSSDLPIVGRMLRSRYGRRVRRSPYPYLATAIGLAVSSDIEAGYHLQERFTRHFGVWREADSGRGIAFDPIYHKGTLLPAAAEPPLRVTRRYHPVHNVGRFRYLECSRISDGQPAGDITPWDEIVFSLDPALRSEPRPERIEVQRAGGIEPHLIEERYCCDADGMIEVTIANLTAGYERTFRLRQSPNRPNPEQKTEAGR